jgi:hypothetical protein
MIFMMIPPRRRRHVQVGPVALTVTVWPGGGARLRITHCQLGLVDSESDLDFLGCTHWQCRAGLGGGFKFKSQVFKLARGRRFAGPGSEPEPEPRSGLGTHPCKGSSSLQGKNYRASRQSRFFPGRPDRGRPPAWRRTVNFKFRVPGPRAGCHYDPSHPARPGQSDASGTMTAGEAVLAQSR